MITSTKKISKQEERQIEFELNHLRIQWITGLSDLSYNNYVFGFGMRFLEELFDCNWPIITSYSFDPKYWSWWVSEFNQWEKELLEFINDHNPEVDREFWISEMEPLIYDSVTYGGFKNYLKLIRNVRI